MNRSAKSIPATTLVRMARDGRIEVSADIEAGRLIEVKFRTPSCTTERWVRIA